MYRQNIYAFFSKAFWQHLWLVCVIFKIKVVCELEPSPAHGFVLVKGKGVIPVAFWESGSETGLVFIDAIEIKLNWTEIEQLRSLHTSWQAINDRHNKGWRFGFMWLNELHFSFDSRLKSNACYWWRTVDVSHHDYGHNAWGNVLKWPLITFRLHREAAHDWISADSAKLLRTLVRPVPNLPPCRTEGSLYPPC